jgi:hypothetical protein
MIVTFVGARSVEKQKWWSKLFVDAILRGDKRQVPKMLCFKMSVQLIVNLL